MGNVEASKARGFDVSKTRGDLRPADTAPGPAASVVCGPTASVVCGPAASVVYGPVASWRLGRSLGVDLLLVDSVCSFRCVYCQLGGINVHTAERRVYVPTARALAELGEADWRGADAVTFSGSGEPTLAANLGEVIRGARGLTGKSVVVLTNSAHLSDGRVRAELDGADQVFCKLDAADEEGFRRLNRPAPGLTLAGVVEGIRRLREEFAGRLAVQLMLTPANVGRAAEFAPLLRRVRPDEVQVNEPLRPVPRGWRLEARGQAGPAGAACEGRVEGPRLKRVAPAEAAEFAQTLRRLTGLEVVSRAGGARGRG